jgi:DNA-directed RNA polymerase subunit M/transcription elongation factor TFIIS
MIRAAQAQEWLVRYGVEPVKMWGTGEASGGKMRSNATVDEKCPKCNNPQLEYYTMQVGDIALPATSRWGQRHGELRSCGRTTAWV